MPTMRYDLKLADGKVATWPGVDPEDAIRRFQDCRPDSEVVAWRVAQCERYGVFQWGRGNRIVE